MKTYRWITVVACLMFIAMTSGVFTEEPAKIPPEMVKRLNISKDGTKAYLTVDITDDEFAFLENAPRLQTIGFSGVWHPRTDCRVITDAGMAHLAGLTEMRDLDISCSVKITDAGMAHLAGMTEMRKLDLGRCEQITDAGLENLAGMTQLEWLHFYSCKKITDDGLKHLTGLTQLKTLSLDSCNLITDAGLEHLAGLTELRYLILVGCQVTDEGVQKLQESLPECQIKTKWPTIKQAPAESKKRG